MNNPAIIARLRAACFGVHPRALLNTLAVEAGRYPDPPDRSDDHRGRLVWTARMNAEFGQQRAQDIGDGGTKVIHNGGQA